MILGTQLARVSSTTGRVMSQQKTSLVKYEHSLNALTDAYGDASRFNLLVPKTGMTDVPRGMRLVASRIEIDPDPDHGDVYKVPGPGGKLAIGKAKLNAIANAIGINWVVSERVDDRRHPHYVEWRVVGKFVLPDGTVVTRPGHKTIDLRTEIGDGTRGAELEEIIAVAAKRQRDPDDQIRKARQNIQSIAETKAMNRSIRSAAGLQTSYTRAQLVKPFIAVKLAVDPRSEIGGQAALAALYGNTQALFGPAPFVDAEIVTPSTCDQAAPRGDQVEAEVGGASEDPPTSHDEPIVDPETGEVTSLLQPYALECKARGMSEDIFEALRRATLPGVAPHTETEADIAKLRAVVGEYFAGQGGDA